LISKLVDEQLKPGNLARQDVVQIAFLILVAGNATMVSMIALGVVELMKHPEQFKTFKMIRISGRSLLSRNSVGTIPPVRWQPRGLLR